MKLNEVVNKKLQAACNRLKKRLKQAGYSEPSHSVDVQVTDDSTVTTRVEFNLYISAAEEATYERELRQIASAVEEVLEPTRVIDNSYFGGHSERLIKRGKKIDADALLTDIELIAKLPVNRYR